ncbi:MULTISPECIES: PTS fructose transporter subunit IIABC [unclassified Arthrobacter]|uniref:PTS fructose transporter subunit IIABC n=1 Tax=unclassified Arthrobacter TaxID=235627 RepID=UPI001D146913|nr:MULTISPECIES: fructose-specific PTS transporter subunit EIIC [unclassified Arthrobacter]MCC3275755.1 fructose-specific PTS transporter subunit EIIC [Arthrobacter sp. zg-Y20]MCC9177194.1 fructose-specific PTS transporter subunit EIIC [Arthrobacter sp. zg-Y750]MDK1315912.1 fructose-specific PTS transporter subunit EIIC [Arthrobacter sp. zg.Y20]WIB06308.1 fructose-specific PTS transporter subunit EIIC [Arthrobacter sp. zg-Y20]
MSDLITPDLVTLDSDLGADKGGVIEHLARNVVSAGRATSYDELYADAMAREGKTATGVPGGIAIPHCRSAAVTKATLAMARLRPAVDWGAKDGPADIVFFIAAPEGADQEHLQLLAKLARSLIRKDFTGALRSAGSPQQIVELVDGALGLGPAPAEAGSAAGAGGAAAAGTATGATAAGTDAGSRGGGQAAGTGGSGGDRGGGHGADAPASEGGTGATTSDTSKSPHIVAVTACPTGIAHTYMAADSLAAAAAERGIDLQVETQGSAKSTPLDPTVIRNADAVIFATDVDVRDKGRFAGKPVISGPVKRGIDEPGVMIDEALESINNPNARRVSGGGGGGEEREGAASGGESFGGQLKRALLTGVSYMIPFVAGGGLLIALGYLLGGYELALASDGGDGVANGDVMLDGTSLFSLPPEGLIPYLGAVFWKIGNLSLAFLVPALAGYIAYALADRPGIAPGFTAGSVALFMDAGFIGGIIGGLLAGYMARWIGNWNVPSWMRGLMPVVIIPLLASLIASGLMILVLGGPIAALTLGLNNWLTSLTGVAAIGLGVILGLMMGSDLGGPINKVAYAFAVAGLGEGSFENQVPWEIMAAVMAAGMVPPLGMAFASTVLAKNRFSMALRENGKAAWLLGAAFISEGAIPFAAADFFRVIPSTMLGGAVAGAICMATGVTSQAPHGGIFVFFAIGNLLMFVVAILAGAAVTGFVYVGLKRFVAPRRKVEEPVAA